jgi:hypothetical protein
MEVKTPMGRKARRRARSRSRSGANSSEENEDCQTRSSQGWNELAKQDIFEHQASSNNCKKTRWVAYDEYAQTTLFAGPLATSSAVVGGAGTEAVDASAAGRFIKPTICRNGPHGDFFAAQRRVVVGDPGGAGATGVRVGDTVFLRHVHTKISNLDGIEGIVEVVAPPRGPPDPSNGKVTVRMTNSMFRKRRIHGLDIFNVVVFGKSMDSFE